VATNPIRVGLDLSCAFERPLTGVGYAALFQVRALAAGPEPFDLRLFATRARHAPAALDGMEEAFTCRVVCRNLRRAKRFLWLHAQWPPMEWFCGELDIAHGLFHQLPAARRAARIVTVHDLSFLRLPETHTKETVRHHSAFLRQAARKADACIAVSQSCRDDLLELLHVPPERVFVVPQGVRLEEFAGELDEHALGALQQRLGIRGPYYVHLGTIEPRKNIPRLLQAYHRVRQRRSNCPQLVLVGTKGWLYEPSFRAIRDLGLEADVVHAGYLPRGDAVLLLRGALACAYPSLYEGFGLPALEAMAAGTPVITSNRTALPEVVGDTGILVDPENVDAIEAALEDVLEQPDRAADRAGAARVRAREFTWQRSAAALAAVYRRLVG